MFNLIKSLNPISSGSSFTKMLTPSTYLKGNKAEYFAGATNSMNQATYYAKDAATDVAWTGANAAAVGMQLGAGVLMFEAAAGKVITLNATTALASTIAGYAAPNAFYTKLLGYAATATSAAAKAFANDPISALAVAEVITIVASPQYAINTVKGTAATIYEAEGAVQRVGEAAFNAFAGVALSVEELIGGKPVNTFEGHDALAGVSFEQFMSDFVVL